MLWRLLIAIVAVLLAFALIPPVLRVLQFSVSGDVLTIVRVCIAGLAIFYVLRGPNFPG